MTTSELTYNEMFETLTGWDEIAIRKAFGSNVTDFARKDANGNPADPMMFARALAFVDRRRRGEKDAEAYASAMGLTISEVDDYFADDPADGDPIAAEDAEGNVPTA